jgi:hypothetical protein
MTITFHQHRLAAPEYGNIKERRGQVKRGEVVGYLIYDKEAGEGEVVIKKHFDPCDIIEADMLKDWIGLLDMEYERRFSDAAD